MINSNALTGTNLAFPTVCSPTLPNPGSYAAQTNPDPNDLFYMEFRYDVPFSSTSGAISGMPSTNIQKSGNIAQMAWRVKGRDRQSYNFTYDYLNRLTSATYYDVNSTNTASATNRFNETLTYDLRGNILSLNRTGFYQNGTVCGYGTIDQLSYNITPSTNKLATVTDAAPTTNNQRTQGFNPGTSTIGYTYDVNGNLKTDSYKGITDILYNHLNLPTSIRWGTSKKIDFQYDASGVQLSRTVYTGTTINYRQDYVAGVEYRTVGATRKLESIAHAEGRRYNTNVNTASTTEALRLEYAIRDHLGNTRIMFTDKNNNGVIDVYKAELDNEIILENHYYPFGMTFGGNVWMNESTDIDNRYQYNGKELNNDHGLGWYNYGARFYDAVLGRFTGVDPLASEPEQIDKSPFAHTWNNPVRFIDPDGRMAVDVIPPTDLYNTSGKKIGTDGVDNGVKMVVTDNKEARQISKTKGNVDLSTVQSGVTLPSDATLQESVNVLDRTVANGGLREESSIVMNDGTVVQGQTGSLPTIVNGVQTATASLPNLPAGTTPADAEATIHSHPTTVQQVGNMIYPQSANTPSGTDRGTFSQYNTNIIVGPLGTVNPNNVTTNPNGTLNFPNRTNGAVIYDRNTTPQVELTRKAIKNIIKN